MFNFLKNEIENSFLSSSCMKHSLTGDGRLDSAESEAVVIEHLKDLFKDNNDIEIIDAPRPRYWYDILIKTDNKVYPVNVKITSGSGADNVNSKEGLFYTLTGLWPENVRGLSRWESYNILLMIKFILVYPVTMKILSGVCVKHLLSSGQKISAVYLGGKVIIFC